MLYLLLAVVIVAAILIFLLRPSKSRWSRDDDQAHPNTDDGREIVWHIARDRGQMVGEVDRSKSRDE